MQLIREVEQHALAIRGQFPETADFMAIEEPAPALSFAMDRLLYTPPFKPRLADSALAEGEGDIPADALFDQPCVDDARLAAQIRRALQTRQQVSLAELVEAHPIRQGLAELVAYLSLAEQDRLAVIDDGRRQTLVWTDGAGTRRQASLPLVIFTHRLGEPADFPGIP